MGINNISMMFQIIVNQSSKIWTIIAYINNLFANMEILNVNRVLIIIVKSIYS